MAEKDTRTRNWAMIVYPESAPENWREFLDNLHVPWIASPLHDKDVNPDGTKKKPHWHVIIVFTNVKAYHQVKEITDKLNAPIPQPCDLRGYIRYLVHTDNPEKYQYPRSEIENHGVDDIDKYFQTASSKRKILKALVKHIKEEHVTNMLDLIDYAISRGDDWFDVVSQHSTIFLSAVIKAEWQKQQNQVIKQGHNTFSGEADKLSGFEEKRDKARKMAEMGIKQATIADTLGVSTRTVKKYINGK